MEFSQYILDVVTSIDYVTKDHDSRLLSILREASKNAPSETESHVLDVIALPYSIMQRIGLSVHR